MSSPSRLFFICLHPAPPLNCCSPLWHKWQWAKQFLSFIFGVLFIFRFSHALSPAASTVRACQSAKEAFLTYPKCFSLSNTFIAIRSTYMRLLQYFSTDRVDLLSYLAVPLLGECFCWYKITQTKVHFGTIDPVSTQIYVVQLRLPSFFPGLQNCHYHHW